MEHRDFICWLRGFFEACGGEPLTPEQCRVIKDHLEKLFIEIKPLTDAETTADAMTRALQARQQQTTSAPSIFC